MDDRTLEMTMLFDFFGDLLTEKQREYFDLYHNEDLSLSEIGAGAGITRQGVYDIITRAERTLIETERKTGIIRRWSEMQTQIEAAAAAANELARILPSGEMAELANKLVSILSELKG